MYRQPLRSEARLGSTTGLTGPRAVGLAAEAENRQPLQMESCLSSVTVSQVPAVHRQSGQHQQAT